MPKYKFILKNRSLECCLCSRLFLRRPKNFRFNYICNVIVPLITKYKYVNCFNTASISRFEVVSFLLLLAKNIRRDMFKTLSNIYDGTFCKNSQRLTDIKNFCKMVHHGSLTYFSPVSH